MVTKLLCSKSPIAALENDKNLEFGFYRQNFGGLSNFSVYGMFFLKIVIFSQTLQHPNFFGAIFRLRLDIVKNHDFADFSVIFAALI
jgi:hypothetical protein